MKKLSKRGLTTKPWHEKSIDECKKVISNLTTQNVNLLIFKERKYSTKIPSTTQRYFEDFFEEFQGNISQLRHPYILFRFNPLNQNRSKKDQETLLKERIGHDFNEDHMIMEQELEFMYNVPTYQFVFGLLDIENVEDNNIYLFNWINFNPIPILGV